MSTESRPPSEGEFPIVRLNPATLMKNNPAFLALNPAALDGKADEYGNKFKLSAYQKGRVVKVRSVNGLGDYRLWDGHNRTDGAAKKGITSLEYEDASKLVLEEFPGQTELTVSDYLAVLAKKTAPEILKSRMAGHVLAEWRTEVGDEIADSYTALALLGELAYSDRRELTIAEIEQRAKEKSNLKIDETPKERKAIEKGIVAFATVLKEKKIPFGDVAHNAFLLAAKLDEPTLQREVRGFLALPEVHTKVEDPQQLETAIIIALKNSKSFRDSRALFEILTNPEVPFNNTLSLLSSNEGALYQRYTDFIRTRPVKKTGGSSLRPARETFPKSMQEAPLRRDPTPAPSVPVVREVFPTTREYRENPLEEALNYLPTAGVTDEELVREIVRTGEKWLGIDRPGTNQLVLFDLPKKSKYERWTEDGFSIAEMIIEYAQEVIGSGLEKSARQYFAASESSGDAMDEIRKQYSQFFYDVGKKGSLSPDHPVIKYMSSLIYLFTITNKISLEEKTADPLIITYLRGVRGAMADKIIGFVDSNQISGRHQKELPEVLRSPERRDSFLAALTPEFFNS